MPRLPAKIPNRSKVAQQWNAMVDYLKSIKPAQSASVSTSHTTLGTLRHASPKSTGGSGRGAPVWLP